MNKENSPGALRATGAERQNELLNYTLPNGCRQLQINDLFLAVHALGRAIIAGRRDRAVAFAAMAATLVKEGRR